MCICLQWNFTQSLNIFFHENTCVNVFETLPLCLGLEVLACSNTGCLGRHACSTGGMYLKILHHMLWSKNSGRNYTLVKSLGKWGVKTIHWASCWKKYGCRSYTSSTWHSDKNPSKNYWQFSSTILIRFSCNNRWDFQKCPCNSHLQFSSNSHQTILIQFSPAILIQFSPDNSHPILTWQFSSNSHLTILTYNSHSIFINTAPSVLTNNAQPIFS